MRKIFQYILMTVALVAAASCSNELDEVLQPAGNGSLQFVVSDFPAFGESPDTRVIGTQDVGKTAWDKDDQIIVTLTSKKFGAQSAVLTYNGTSWSTAVSFLYLDNETPAVSAIYAPCYEVTEDGVMKLSDGMQLGMTEYIPAKTTVDGLNVSISFKDVTRTYSRLRLASEAGQELTVVTTGFTPAGATSAVADDYTLTTDDNGNAFLYGVFAEGATVSVNVANIEIVSHAFASATEECVSYALDAIAIPKYFSVSAESQVTFSPGNLQYHPKNKVWRFAPSQLNYIGDDNSKLSATYNGWIDLFGMSGTKNNDFGVSTSTTDYDYSGSFVDWGTNTIGSDAPNTWRTLTFKEWYYLLDTRANAKSLRGIAQVDGVNGMILLPDNWKCPSGVTFKSGDHSSEGADYYAAYQTFTADQWSKLEAAGAVFLPAAGRRKGTTMYAVKSWGRYWTSTSYNSNYSYDSSFNSQYLNTVSFPTDSWMNKSCGLSVRLVKDLQ